MRRSGAQVIMVAAAMLVAGGTQAQAVPADGPPTVLGVGSDDAPAGFTVTSSHDIAVDVVATGGAEQATATLDGRALPARAMRAAGPDSLGQIRFSAAPGAHDLAVSVTSSAGRSRIVHHRFSVAETRGGRVLAPDGRPAPGLRVSFRLANAAGPQWAQELGSAVTKSDGTWALPDLSLSAAAKSAAAANDGVLNLEAIVDARANTRTGRQVPLLGSTLVRVGVGTSRAADEAKSAPVQDAVVLPSGTPGPGTAPVTTRPSLASLSGTAPLGSESLAQRASTATGGDGINWAMATISPARTSAAPPKGVIAAASGVDGCYYTGQGVKIQKSSTTRYSTVMEGHSARDSFATVSYNTTAGTAFSSGLSHDFGKSWSVSADSYVGNNMGVNTGYARKGPSYSYEWTVPIEYRLYEYWVCGLRSGVYRPVTYQASRTQAIQYKVPAGGYVGKSGRDVSSRDGYYGYRDAPYKGKVEPRGYFDLVSAKTNKYTASASAFAFNFSAETSMSTTRSQRIDAGTTSTGHYIFGYQPIREGMKAFYAY